MNDKDKVSAALASDDGATGDQGGNTEMEAELKKKLLSTRI